MKTTVVSFAVSDNIRIILILFVGIAALNTSALAQTWSSEQEEIWQAVEAVWDNWMKGSDSHVSENFVGWTTDWHAPYTKNDMKPWGKRFHEKNDPILVDLNPLAIEIHGDVAIAFYTYRLLLEDKDGKETTVEGRWVDIYKTEKGKWMLISESGHVTS